MRACRAACKAAGNYRLTGSPLYVPREPCLMWAGAIVHARIDAVEKRLERIERRLDLQDA